MKKAGWIFVIYGLLVFAGGIVGHIQAKSQVSLIAGTIFGVLLVLTGVGTHRNHLLPAYIGILLSVVLAALFIYRYLLTLGFFPAGLMSLISIGVLVTSIVWIRQSLRYR